MKLALFVCVFCVCREGGWGGISGGEGLRIILVSVRKAPMGNTLHYSVVYIISFPLRTKENRDGDVIFTMLLIAVTVQTARLLLE